LFLLSVIHHHVKTAGHGDEKLVASFQGVSGAVGAPGHVVKVKHPLDLKGHVPVPFDEGQITARVGNLWQVNNYTVV
jgi:hypothetical protein